MVSKDFIETVSVLVAIFLVTILISGALLLPTKIVSYQVDIPYVDIENMTIDIPYEDIEEYVKLISFEEMEEYIQRIPVEQKVPDIDEDDLSDFLTNYGRHGTCNSSEPCPRSITVDDSRDIDYKTVITYQEVKKERPRVRYKNETRNRTITKTRTEIHQQYVQKTRVETRTKEVNWFFGFDALIPLRKVRTGSTESPT